MNWLYLNITNVGGGSGLLFSGTITTTSPGISVGGVCSTPQVLCPMARSRPARLQVYLAIFPSIQSHHLRWCPFPQRCRESHFNSGQKVSHLWSSSRQDRPAYRCHMNWRGRLRLPDRRQQLNGQVGVPQTLTLAPAAPGIFTIEFRRAPGREPYLTGRTDWSIQQTLPRPEAQWFRYTEPVLDP